MTGHPITQSLKNTLVYASVWFVIITVHTAGFIIRFDLDFAVAIGDAFTFNFLFAIIGIVLWYPVFYIDPSKYSVSNLILNHVSILALTLTFWISLSVFILKSLFGDVEEYLHLIELGIPGRVYVGIFYYFIIVLVYYLFVYTVSLKEHIEHEARLKQRVNEAELNALKSQINPHFLI